MLRHDGDFITEKIVSPTLLIIARLRQPISSSCAKDRESGIQENYLINRSGVLGYRCCPCIDIVLE
jgi:hypothetical protein